MCVCVCGIKLLIFCYSTPFTSIYVAVQPYKINNDVHVLNFFFLYIPPTNFLKGFIGG